MEKNIIELIDINKIFEDDGKQVLSSINLSIKEKEFVTFLGPSGCGKTTTLRIIGGFTSHTSGKVLFDGNEITNVPPYKRQINTVFQKYALFPHLNIYENIAFGLRIKKLDESTIDKKVKKMLKLVNLEGFENREVQSLSGGQQQRIAIARALVNEPKVLLLDEPTAALDTQSEVAVQSAIDKLVENKTVIVIAHRLTTIKDVEQIVVFDSGKISEIGKHDELLKNFGVYNKLWNNYENSQNWDLHIKGDVK